jgi:hypothetical protein
MASMPCAHPEIIKTESTKVSSRRHEEHGDRSCFLLMVLRVLSVLVVNL